MGIWDSFSDMMAAAAPWSIVEAEAPNNDDKEEDNKEEESKDDDAEDSKDGEDAEDVDKKKDEGGDEEEEEEEEDEEEIVDPKEQLEEECKESKGCAPYKHHFDECVERVTGGESHAGKEDCVEEFFHLAHCANQCAAPKLWASLK